MVNATPVTEDPAARARKEAELERERERDRQRRTCTRCGEPMPKRSHDGLCGFCQEELGLPVGRKAAGDAA